jgi:hypothetical protein
MILIQQVIDQSRYIFNKNILFILFILLFLIKRHVIFLCLLQFIYTHLRCH